MNSFQQPMHSLTARSFVGAGRHFAMVLRTDLSMISALVLSPAFLGFIAASVVLAVTPGPGVIYIVTRTLSRGRNAGLASVCGIAIGGLGNAVAASIGLAAVLSASATAFLVIKLARRDLFRDPWNQDVVREAQT